MGGFNRLLSLITAAFASLLWYGVCFLTSLIFFRFIGNNPLVFGIPATKAFFYLTLILFSGGFLISIIRRSFSIATLQSADKGSRTFQDMSAGSSSVGTEGSILVVIYIASFLPDFAVGAIRVALGFNEVETKFSDRDIDVC